MLRFLSVRHLAVIDHLEVEFEPGLNVLTGETGAGKTVLVAAIDLLVGGRASADLVRTGEELASVQAIFERSDGREVIVRREISAQGRSRAFIDDVLATSAAVRDLGSTLVDLHGQHEHQALIDPAEHIEVLDAFGAYEPRAQGVATLYDQWRVAKAALERTHLNEREKRARIDMATFQLEEIERAGATEGEDDRLMAERAVLANADKLARLSSDAYASLYEGEGAALSALASVWKRIEDLAQLDPKFAPYLDQRADLKSRLEDLAFFLRSYRATLETSPDRLQAVEDRLAALERLKKKHGPTLANVLAYQRRLKDELTSLEAGEERTAALEAKLKETTAAFLAGARALSEARHEAAKRLERALIDSLGALAMPKSRVQVQFNDLSATTEQWTRRGIDDVEFLLSPNPGEELRPLARVASGGELSRIMLALRTLATRDEPGRTLVFDEVDVGIGGAAADAVGMRLQMLSRRYQVLCITHLAQIAARGRVHFQIAKQVQNNRTLTTMTKLDEVGREIEIARMIAGAQISAQVIASARELLSKRRDGESKAKGEDARNTKPGEASRGKSRGA